MDKTLLMLTPTQPASTEPVIDAFTQIMAAALINTEHKNRYRGFHTCACGAHSDNIDHWINGYRTNSLAVHYLAHHRNEVPEEEINKMMAVCGFEFGAVKPPKWMLLSPSVLK